MKFHPSYLVAAFALFAVEVLIALFLHDRVIRLYVGDALAVVLMYAALRGVSRLPVPWAAALALLIAFAIELGQLVHLTDYLGLGRNQLASFVFGHQFEVRDLCTYVVGMAVVLLVRPRGAVAGLALD